MTKNSFSAAQPREAAAQGVGGAAQRGPGSMTRAAQGVGRHGVARQLEGQAMAEGGSRANAQGQGHGRHLEHIALTVSKWRHVGRGAALQQTVRGRGLRPLELRANTLRLSQICSSMIPQAGAVLKLQRTGRWLLVVTMHTWPDRFDDSPAGRRSLSSI